MSKPTEHQPVFTLHFVMAFMVVPGLSLKNRPKEKLVFLGIYEVERIVSKRN